MEKTKKPTQVFYRNKNQIDNVDPGCLWELKGHKLVLVDEDQYVFVNFQKHQHEFTKVD